MAERRRHLYDVLGVDPEAETAAIRQAFRARARELHPDVSTDPDAADRFAEVARAYAVLSHPTSRLLYDRIGYLGPANGGFEDRPRSGPPPDDARKVFALAEVEVEAVEAMRGRRRRVRVACVGPCSGCGGSGAAPLICGGDGRIVAEACALCKGTGRTRGDRKLTLRIPPGSTSGQLVSAEPNGNGTDDVLVVLRVKPERDSPLVRYAAAAALVLALALFVVVALMPDAVAG